MEGAAASVLVADDEHLLRRLIGRVLAAEGIGVIAAADGEAALRCCLEREFGAAMIDVNLPPKGCTELCETLRLRSPDTRLILMSGSPLDAAHRARLDAWNGTFLEKPFASRELLRVVMALLAREDR